jgi:hypothetical protein
MATIDASVYACDFDVRDPEHATCRALLARLAADATPIIVPLLLLVEVVASISRERRDPIVARLPWMGSLRSRTSNSSGLTTRWPGSPRSYGGLCAAWRQSGQRRSRAATAAPWSRLIASLSRTACCDRDDANTSRGARGANATDTLTDATALCRWSLTQQHRCAMMIVV